MKYLLILFMSIVAGFNICAQVSINNNASLPDNSAMLDIKSSTKGLLIPRTAIGNISSPANGLIIYDTSTNSFKYFNGLLWNELSSVGPNAWNIVNNDIYNANTGNVGIGTQSPITKLDINSANSTPLRINGAPSMFISLLEEGNYRGYIGSYAGNAEDVDFGTGSGNGTGKLHLTIQASPKLTIASNGNVGIGNINPANKLDVSGDINFTGLLKMTGLPGTAGQVLTSKGAAAPVWQNAAFSDNIRFGLRFNGADNSVIPVSNIYYNLSPADITVALGANNISINQTGLYHFEGVYFGLVQGSGFTGAPEMTMFFQLTGNSNYGMNLSTWKQLTLRTNVINNWFHQDNFSIDLYITAPAQLQFGVQFLSSNTPSYSEGSVTLYGHRISL